MESGSHIVLVETCGCVVSGVHRRFRRDLIRFFQEHSRSELAKYLEMVRVSYAGDGQQRSVLIPSCAAGRIACNIVRGMETGLSGYRQSFICNLLDVVVRQVVFHHASCCPSGAPLVVFSGLS